MPLSVKEKQAYRAQAEAALEAKTKKTKAELHRQALAAELRAEKAAADQEAEVKRTALQVFLSEGGSRAQFEKGWPKLYRDIIFQRTLERMSTGDPFGVRATLSKLKL